MNARVMVVSPAPTANGDLHLGHIAGPFLAADVCCRYLRATGREVAFGTGIQDTQTYVVTTARRLGITPQALVASSAADVAASLSAMGVDVDGFTGVEERFTKVVDDFMDRLHATGRLRVRTLRFPYSRRTGEFLVDGYVSGTCPTCLAAGCGGLCESCAHPILADEILDPRPTRDPDEPIEWREAQVVVLPLEEFRDELLAYYAPRWSTMRPHMAHAVEQMLSRPLPDFPLSYPISWGIPARFPEVAGQVINSNAETMAWSIHCGALSAENRGVLLDAEDEWWRPESGTKVVYFLGFDNIYPFAVAGLAMLMALGTHRLPEQFITNEFYELDHEKFSTSRGHVVSGRDLAAGTPRDVIRFYLATSSPEYQRSNFSAAALAQIADSRLVRPWNRVAARADAWIGRGPLPVSAASHARAARMVERFTVAYELPRFSLNRAAETLVEQLSRLDRWAVEEADAGDYVHEIEVFLRCAAPILIDLAAKVLPEATFPSGPPPAEVTATPLPRFPTRAD